MRSSQEYITTPIGQVKVGDIILAKGNFEKVTGMHGIETTRNAVMRMPTAIICGMHMVEIHEVDKIIPEKEVITQAT